VGVDHLLRAPGLDLSGSPPGADALGAADFSSVSAFFLAVMAFAYNPFAPVLPVPPHGRSLEGRAQGRTWEAIKARMGLQA